jgi:hypothetical protein
VLLVSSHAYRITNMHLLRSSPTLSGRCCSTFAIVTVRL